MNRERTDGVLDAIDHAVEDWTVSGDAMRWMPKRPQTSRPARRGDLSFASTGGFHAAPLDHATATVWAGGAWQHIGYVGPVEFHLLPGEEVLFPRRVSDFAGEALTFEVVDINHTTLMTDFDGLAR